VLDKARRLEGTGGAGATNGRRALDGDAIERDTVVGFDARASHAEPNVRGAVDYLVEAMHGRDVVDEFSCHGFAAAFKLQVYCPAGRRVARVRAHNRDGFPITLDGKCIV
jgi:hypothetical protein